MNKLGYKEIFKILDVCRDTFKEASQNDEEELQIRLDKYIKENKGNSIIAPIGSGNEKSPLETRYIACTAYIWEIYRTIMDYFFYLTRISYICPPLNLFCDYQNKNTNEAGAMISLINELSQGEISQKNLEQLAGYISSMPSKKRDCRIKLISGIIIYLDLIIMLVVFVVKNMH